VDGAAQLQRLQAGAAADTAGAGRREVALEATQVWQAVTTQVDGHDVVPLFLVEVAIDAVPNGRGIVAIVDHAFADEEPDSQLEIRARRSHRYRQPLGRPVTGGDADLERLLGRDVVDASRAPVAVVRGDADACPAGVPGGGGPS
jgi:hypothetical protein